MAAKDGMMVTITPDEMLKLWLAHPDMSVAKFHALLLARGEKVSRMTVGRWSRKFNWVKARAATKSAVVQAAQAQAADTLAEQMIPQVATLTDLAKEALELALGALRLKRDDLKNITIAEACRLADCSVAALRAAELLAGRPDNRTEHTTRAKVSSLFDEMHRELEDALERSEVIYAVPSPSETAAPAVPTNGNGGEHTTNGEISLADIINEVDGRPWKPPQH